MNVIAELLFMACISVVRCQLYSQFDDDDSEDESFYSGQRNSALFQRPMYRQQSGLFGGGFGYPGAMPFGSMFQSPWSPLSTSPYAGYSSGYPTQSFPMNPLAGQNAGFYPSQPAPMSPTGSRNAGFYPSQPAPMSPTAGFNTGYPSQSYPMSPLAGGNSWMTPPSNPTYSGSQSFGNQPFSPSPYPMFGSGGGYGFNPNRPFPYEGSGRFMSEWDLLERSNYNDNYN